MCTRNKKERQAPVANPAEKKFHFEKLAPIDTADIDVYEEAIDFAFENDDIRNIAISGAYGSGKSSLLATYKKKHEDKKFIHISLAHFKPDRKEEYQVKLDQTPRKTPSKPSKEPEEDMKPTQDESHLKPSESILEGKILNQLIHQLNAEDIPQTNFRVKKTLTKAQVVWQSIAIISLIVTVIHLALSSVWINFVSSFTPGCWFRNILELTTTPGSFFVSGCVGLVIISYFISTSVKRQRFKATVRKLSLQGNDIELFESENDSFFDKYLNEVLYLFENAGVNAIVFEDMDRYDMEGIFERLHEVNTLANIRLTRKRKKPVKFFFLLRDDLFVSKDRTKFFDYIIPVIPIVDSSNSYDQFIKLTSVNSLNNLFKDKFLQGISLFIDDMRLLKNICNEFLIYYKRLGSTELDPNKLLAIIVYKNIFPRDFSELQINKGFVCTLFNQKEDFTKAKAEQLKEKIELIDAEIRKIKEEHLISQREVDAVFVDKYFKNYSLLDYDDTRLTNWLKDNLSGSELSEYTMRKDLLEKKLSAALDQLEEKRSKIIDEQQRLKQKKLSQIIDRENSKQVFSVVSQNALGEITSFDDVKRNQYFNLLKYLITDGYIDETYADYLTYFYPHSITTADKVFLQRVANRTAADYSFELKKPALVFEKLNVYSFDEPETLNFSLLTYMLTYDPAKECVQRLIDQVRTTEKYDFIAQYFDCTSEKAKFVVAVNLYWPGFFGTAVEKGILSKQQLWEYSHDTLYYSPDEDIKKVNVGRCLEKYISSQPDFLNVSPGNYDSLVQGLLLLGVKFEAIDYTKADHNLFKKIYEHSCYALNYNNIALMLTIIYGVEDANDIRHKNYSSIISKPDAALAQYIDRNIDMYANAMLDFCENDIQDCEKDAITFLNHSGISIEQKQKYISKLKTKISQLGAIEYTSLWGDLLNFDVVEFSEDNIIEYWSNFKEFDSHLTSFVNNSQQTVDLSSAEKKFDDDLHSELFRQIVKCKDLRNDNYIDMLTSMNRSYQRSFSVTGIPDDKMELLIDAGIIYMAADILKSVRQNYPNVLYRFIEVNIEDYVGIMTPQLLVHQEVLEILSWAVDDDFKLTLLKLSNTPISVVGKGYSTAITLYILQKRIDTTDMQTLSVEYPKLADEVNLFVVSYAEPRIDSLISGTLKSSDNLKLKMLSSPNVNENNKYKLLHTMLARVNKQWGKACFEHLRLSEFAKIFDSHAKPKIPKNDKNKKILDVLVSREWIHDYPDYPYDSNYYTVRRNAPSKKRELTKV